MRGLMRAGAFAPDAAADRITRSGPGWTSILTGVSSPAHGVVDNSFAGYRAEAHPSLFRRLRASRPDLRLAAAVAWAPLATHLLPSGGHPGAGAPVRAFADDDSVASAAVRLLADGEAPDLLFLHFDAPDYAGHRYGFSRFSPPYRIAIRKTDARIGRVLAALRDREARPEGAGEEWLVLVVTDHGGTMRHHGEDIPACRRVPLIASGRGYAPGSALRGAALTDVTPTVLEWLGVAVGEEWGLEGLALSRRGIPGDRAAGQAFHLLEEEGGREGLGEEVRAGVPQLVHDRIAGMVAGDVEDLHLGPQQPDAPGQFRAAHEGRHHLVDDEEMDGPVMGVADLQGLIAVPREQDPVAVTR
jgi:arylsulfatase A-like enzyme